MSDFNFKVNIKGAKIKIKRKIALMTKVPMAMKRGGLFFIGDIQLKWYSGRRGEEGLNVQSGRLRDSWFPDVFVQGLDTVLNVNTDVVYARPWEFGREDIDVDKRTDVIGDWETEGLEILRKEVALVLI